MVSKKIDLLVARNKARRKYPENGLTKGQNHYRAYIETYRQKDIRLRHSLIEFLGGNCISCGYNKNIHALVLDHINGGGREDRKRVGTHIARYYMKHLDEARQTLQVLCANCNQIKSIENKEHSVTKRIC